MVEIVIYGFEVRYVDERILNKFKGYEQQRMYDRCSQRRVKCEKKHLLICAEYVYCYVREIKDVRQTAAVAQIKKQ